MLKKHYREARVIGARLTVAVKAALDSFALTVTQLVSHRDLAAWPNTLMHLF